MFFIGNMILVGTLISSSTHLVVELFEVFWCIGVGIGCCIVLHPPTLFQQQSTEPAVFPCREQKTENTSIFVRRNQGSVLNTQW